MNPIRNRCDGAVIGTALAGVALSGAGLAAAGAGPETLSVIPPLAGLAIAGVAIWLRLRLWHGLPGAVLAVATIFAASGGAFGGQWGWLAVGAWLSLCIMFLGAWVSGCRPRPEPEDLPFRENAQRLVTLFETMSEGVLQCDAQGRYTYVNPAAERVLGLSREEILCRPQTDIRWEFLDASGEQLPVAEYPGWKAVSDRYAVENVVVGIRRPDGGVAWVNTNAAPVLEDDGTVSGAVITFADITRRKQTEDALQENERRYRTLIEMLPYSVSIIQNGRIAFANEATLTMFGGSESDPVVGREFLGLVTEEERDRLADYLLKRMADAGDARGRMQTALKRPDGSRFDAEVYVRPMQYGGKPAAQVVAVDISERLQAEADLVRLATVIDQAAEVIVVTDAEGTIRHLNPSFTTVMGYSPAEVLGKKLDVFRSVQQTQGFGQHLQRTIQSGKVWKGRLSYRRKNGTLCELEATISPVRDGHGKIVNYVHVQRDISYETNLESQLRHAQKMEAIGTLAGGIAHDFNNILSAVLGYGELALADAPPESPVVENVEEMVRAAKRAADLVNHILSFSRQTEQERRPIRVQSVLKEALKLLCGSLPKTIEIHTRIADECAPVMADPTQIHQVIMNLCTNAYQAMRTHSRGELNVSLEETAVTPEVSLENLDLEPGNYALITVRDSGEGMDSATVERIFEPYFTTRPKGEGTGLGLAVVHGIVTSHGGAIAVESKPGKGAVFRVFLPLCGHTRPATKAVRVEDVRMLSGKEKVLCVDDEAPIIKMMNAALTRMGYAVTPHTSSLEALAEFEADPHRFDVVITDLTMPGMTGYELAVRMLKLRPDTPIILCTGFSELLDEGQAKEAGIREYVMKPVGPVDLARVIRRISAGQPEP